MYYIYKACMDAGYIYHNLLSLIYYVSASVLYYFPHHSYFSTVSRKVSIQGFSGKHKVELTS